MDDEFDVNDMSTYDYGILDDYEIPEDEEPLEDLPWCGFKGRACGYCNECLN